MSSNTQIHVKPVPISGSSAVSFEELLGNNGAKRIGDLLDQLPRLVLMFDVHQRSDFNWTSAGDRRWSTSVDGYQVTLDLSGQVAQLNFTGTANPRSAGRISDDVMSKAKKRLNNLLALAVANRVSEKLHNYIFQRAGTRVTQKINVKAVNTMKNRMVIRATTGIKLRNRK